MVDESLDISWLNEINRTIHSEDHPLRESLDYINIQYLYISKQNTLVHSITEKYVFPDSCENKLFRTLTNETVLYLIQSKKYYADTRYKCVDALLNLVDIEPDELLDFSRDSFVRSNTFFREVSLIHSIEFPPSIFVFHSVNRLYFIFREMTLVKSVMPVDSKRLFDHFLDPVLSKKPSVSITKKVRISPDAISYSERDRGLDSYNMVAAVGAFSRKKTVKKR